MRLAGTDAWGSAMKVSSASAVHVMPLPLSGVENPYFQYFCGEEFFQHALVLDRSSLTRIAFDISTAAAAPGPAELCGRAKQAAQSRAA